MFATIGALADSISLHSYNNMFILVALLTYDSLLTVEDEVELIWRRKLSIASTVFIINRIAASLFVVCSILSDVDNVRRAFRIDHYHLTARLGVSSLELLASQSSRSASQLSTHYGLVRDGGAFALNCSGLQVDSWLLVMIHIAHTVLGFASMRTYAISDRSILLAVVVGILSMVPVVTDTVCLYSETDHVQMKADCSGDSGLPQEIRLCPWSPFFEAVDERLM